MDNKKRRRQAFIIVPAVILMVVTGCAGARSASSPAPVQNARGYDEGAYGGAGADEVFVVEEAAEAEAPAAEPIPAEAIAADVDFNAVETSVSQQTERLIIRNGNISLQTEDTRTAQAKIDAMVAEMAQEGAFVVDRNVSGGSSDRSPYINMHIRVPVTRFDEAMNRIADLAVEGTTPSRSESGQDVTAEYVDLEVRIESLEAARDRLLELMRNAETTEELLMAEQQLTQREAEIESLKGRQKYLLESAQLSSIYIDLQPYILSQPVDTRWRPAETARRAFDSLVDSAKGFVNFLIGFSIAVLPWLVLFGLIVYGVVRFIIRRVRIGRQKRAAQQIVQAEED